MRSTTLQDTVRVFLAIEVPNEVRDQLSQVQDRLRAQTHNLKLVEPALIHLTVRFLGRVSATRLPAVERAARLATSGVPPFRLHVSRVGTFPERGAPRVVWVGIEKEAGAQTLHVLSGRLEDALVREGFERERRPFAAHLTLARVRDGAGAQATKELRAAVDNAAGEPMRASFEVEGITVMRSDLTSGGPRYTALARLALGGTGEAR